MRSLNSPEILLRTASAYLRKVLRRYGGYPRRYDQIFDYVEKLHAKNIMEIGTYQGARGIAMIERAKKFSGPNGIHYYGFDLFETMESKQFSHEISKQPITIEKTKERIEKTGAHAHLYKGDTLVTLPKEVPSLPKMDLIFIDGGHSFETISNDWKYSSQLMNEKTVIIFDDYWLNREDGAKPIVETIDRAKFNVEILPVVDVFFNPNFGRLVIQLAKVTKR